MPVCTQPDNNGNASFGPRLASDSWSCVLRSVAMQHDPRFYRDRSAYEERERLAAERTRGAGGGSAVLR